MEGDDSIIKSCCFRELDVDHKKAVVIVHGSNIDPKIS
jgi:hypothetical protein